MFSVGVCWPLCNIMNRDGINGCLYICGAHTKRSPFAPVAVVVKTASQSASAAKKLQRRSQRRCLLSSPRFSVWWISQPWTRARKICSGQSLIYSRCARGQCHLRIKLLPARLVAFFQSAKHSTDVSGSACAPNQPGLLRSALFIMLRTANRKKLLASVPWGLHCRCNCSLAWKKYISVAAFRSQGPARCIYTNSTLCVVCLDGADLWFLCVDSAAETALLHRESRMCWPSVGEGKDFLRSLAHGGLRRTQQSMAKLLFVRFTLIRTAFFRVCAAEKTVKTKKRYLYESASLDWWPQSVANDQEWRKVSQPNKSFFHYLFSLIFFHNTNQSAWYYSRKKWTFYLCQPIQSEDGAATK